MSRKSESHADPQVSLRTYLRLLTRIVPAHAAAALVLLLAVGATESIGVMLLLPLLAVVGVDVEGGGAGRLHHATTAAFRVLGLEPTLPVVLAVYAAIVIVQSLLQRSATIRSAVLEEELLLRLRVRLYRAISSAPWLYVARTDQSELSYGLTSRLEEVAGGAYQLLVIATQLTVGGVYLAIALRLSVPMTLVAIGCGSGLLLLQRGMRRRSRRAGERVDSATGDMFSLAEEHIRGLRVIRTHGAEERSARRFHEVNREVALANVDATRSWADARTVFSVGSVLLLSVALYSAVGLLHLGAGGVLLLLLLFSRLTPKFSALQNSYQNILLTVPAFRAVMALIEQWEHYYQPPPSGPAPDVELRESVRLRGVGFSYDPGTTASVLSGLDLVIHAGQVTALVGASGAGKSTIADLVMALLVPQHGAVTADGHVLTGPRLGAWQARVGYVAQDPFLFNDTIRANLQWARPEATEGEMRDVLRAAAADGFVAELPDGLDTVVGDRGDRLSGGQRQRLALARALLRRPTLLILDEATSGIDSDQELTIQRAIGRLDTRVTVLVITHRLSFARHADTIHVLAGGRIVESGSWARLLSVGGRFAEMCTQQGLAPDPAAHRRLGRVMRVAAATPSVGGLPMTEGTAPSEEAGD